MGNPLVRRRLHACAGCVLIALVLGDNFLSPAQPPGTKPETLYYRRVAIDTSVSHAGTDPAAKKWLEDHWTVTQPDPGLVEVKILENRGLGYPGSIWKVQPAAGKASYRQLNNGKQEGTLEVSWTVPPEYLEAGQNYTLSITALATGEVWGGASLWDTPVERFESGADKTVVGKNPFDRVEAGKWSGGFNAKEQGTITVRPKRNAGKFTLQLTLRPSYEYAVHYHYEPLPPGTLPPKQPPEPPITRCDHTFGKEWNTDWGKLVLRLDGNRATGTYTNREGKYGPGTLIGSIAGDVLEGTWKDARGNGMFRLVLSADGCRFTGTHTVNPPGTPGNPAGPTGTDGSSPGTLTPPPTVDGPNDPSSSPIGQGCIDQWIRLAMSILNRRDKSSPSPNGPWRVNEYGQLVGHGVSSGGPPDGWETRYHRSRDAYIWENWQQTHTLPSYGGELPPLKDYVGACEAKHGPPGTPTGPVTTGYPPGTSPATAMSLLAENRKVLAGDTVLVPVWLVNGVDVANINFTVGYDGKVARPEVDPGKGNLLGAALFSANAKEVGLIRLGFAQSKGLSGTGTVAYLPFRTVGKPGDRTPLHLEVQIINNPGGTALTIARIDGSITLVGPDGLLPGDCDGDGALTTIDAKCALDMSVKLIPEKMNMDMDGDGQVTSRDATIILQRRAMFLAKGAP